MNTGTVSQLNSGSGTFPGGGRGGGGPGVGVGGVGVGGAGVGGGGGAGPGGWVRAEERRRAAGPDRLRRVSCHGGRLVMFGEREGEREPRLNETGLMRRRRPAARVNPAT